MADERQTTGKDSGCHAFWDWFAMLLLGEFGVDIFGSGARTTIGSVWAPIS